jgi:type IV pilus assembly protein PilV
MTTSRRAQSGLFILEALVAILIFMLGILGMVGVSAMAVSAQSDAQYRSEAGRLANDISQRIALRVSRTTNPASVATSLAAFEHQAGGAATSCNYTGDASSEAFVADWATAVQSQLPGATAAMQQILVDTDADGFNRVTVHICWRTPADNAPRMHTLVSLVN